MCECVWGCVYEHSCVGVDPAHQSAIHDLFGWDLSNQMINTTISFFKSNWLLVWRKTRLITDRCYLCHRDWDLHFLAGGLYLTSTSSLRSDIISAMPETRLFITFLQMGPVDYTIKETLVGLQIRWQNTASIIHLTHKLNAISEGCVRVLWARYG